MTELLVQLLTALALLTGYRDIPIPEVRTPPAAEFVAIGCGGGCAAAAKYNGGVVYLSQTLDVTTAKGRSDLFHELVHHAQTTRKGPNKDCRDWMAREVEAYALQNRYLSEIENSGTRVYFTGRCVEPETA